MHEQQKKTRTKPGGLAVGWLPLLGAFRDALNWALDRAAHFARDYPDEVETIERVRRAIRARAADCPVRFDADDLLFTFAIVVAALDHDLERIGAFPSWLKQRSIHVPLVTDLERQWVEQVVRTYQALQSRTRAAA